MAYTIINIGVEANDGTGSSLRTAFNTVNDNFQLMNDALYAGVRQSIISALSVQSDYFLSNTYIFANTYVNADSIVGNTVTSKGNLFVSQGGAFIYGNVNIVGNLNVTGSQAASQSSSATAPIILIHANASPYTLDDGTDIGLEWQYYDGSDKYGFLGWQNSTGSLVYLDDVTDSANVITGGTFGNVQFGQLLLSNTTAATSNVTGALQVSGGAGVQGNLFVQSNVFVGNNANVGNITVRGFHVGTLRFAGADTITINGSPVQTAAQAFNGGTVGLATIFADTTASTGLGSGAVRIAGGFSANGNVFVSNLHTIAGGNIRSNIIGNVITNNQPFITSLGTLTQLFVDGQSTTGNIVPSTDNQHWLGNPGSRWVQGHFFNLTASQISGLTQITGAVTHNGVPTFSSNILVTSGTDSTDKTSGAVVITGFGGLGVGGTIHLGGNIYIDNINDAAGLIASTSTAYVFNENAQTVEIGRGGVTTFANATKATSTVTGAVRVTNGGMSIAQGNLYIGSSAGNAIVATGNISTSSNLIAAGNIFGGTSASMGFLGNLFGSPVTGNTHIGAHLLPTSNIAFSLGGQSRRYQTVWANVTNSLFIESGNITTSNIIADGAAFNGVVTTVTAPTATANTMVATTEFVINNSVPTGALMMWSTGTAPTGWLLCNGSAVSRSTYATLFAVIGTTFGLGNGSTTFNLPDYRNRMPVGAGTLYGVGGVGGSKDAIVVSHTHTGSTNSAGAHVHQIPNISGPDARDGGPFNYTTNWNSGTRDTSSAGSHTHSVTVDATGSSGTDANMPPYLGIQFIIKA
jgi:microcystin-dependent protein